MVLLWTTMAGQVFGQGAETKLKDLFQLYSLDFEARAAFCVQQSYTEHKHPRTGCRTFHMEVARLGPGFETREGKKAGRSLSSGLLGWIEGLRADHASGADLAELADRHRLPADYIAQVLAAPDAPEAADAGTEETEQ